MSGKHISAVGGETGIRGVWIIISGLLASVGLLGHAIPLKLIDIEENVSRL